MGIEKETEAVAKEAIEKVSEIKKKYPAFVKWIFGVAAAILLAAVGFFGGIFGLNESQQNKIKQMIISSSTYQEAVADVPAPTADPKADVKEEVKK